MNIPVRHSQRSIPLFFTLAILMVAAGLPASASANHEQPPCHRLAGAFRAVARTYASSSTVELARTSQPALSWRKLQTFPGGSNGGTYDIVVSPNYPQDGTLFVTGYAGIFRSTDRGNTWVEVGEFDIATSLAYSPDYANDRTVMASEYAGRIYRSLDGGTGWLSGPAGGFYLSDFAFSPFFRRDRTVFIGGADENYYNGQEPGLYRTVNAGETWELVALGGQNVSSVVVGPDYGETSHPGRRYATQMIFALTVPDLTLPPPQISKLERSADNGGSWTTLQSDIREVLFSPSFAADGLLLAYSRTGRILKSTNYGDSWTTLSDGFTGTWVNDLIFSPNYATDHTLFSATNKGVYRSADDGRTWVSFNAGLDPGDVANMRGLAAAPRQDRLILYAISDEDAYVYEEAVADIPLYLQTALPWRNDTYASNVNPADDIYAWGCFMSSAAMAISFFGGQQNSSFYTDPRILNEWLTRSDGYDGSNAVKWDAIRRFGVEHGIGVALPETKARGGQDSAYLDLILAQGDLAILGVNTDSDVSDADHFVLATRKTSVNGKPTYVINDPIFGVTTLLEQYGNQYYSILVLTQKVGQIDQRAISISVYQEGGSSAALDHTTTGISKFAPAEILVTDSLGRRSGYDPLTRTIWAEIPNTELLTLSIGSNGSSAPDGSRMGSKMMVISTPAEGEYKIDVTGVGAGSYTVTVNATDVQGSITRTVTRGVAYNGSSDSFNITYAAGSDNIPNGQMFIPSVLK